MFPFTMIAAACIVTAAAIGVAIAIHFPIPLDFEE